MLPSTGYRSHSKKIAMADCKYISPLAGGIEGKGYASLYRFQISCTFSYDMVRAPQYHIYKLAESHVNGCKRFSKRSQRWENSCKRSLVNSKNQSILFILLISPFTAISPAW